MSGNVRISAVKILCLTERGGFADNLIDSTIRKKRFSNPADSALLTEIVMGTLRHRLILDEIITKYLQKSIDRTDEFVRNALRIGVYQILFLNRIPSHAALFETVEGVKRNRGSKLAGFVNGVLRNFLRDLGGGTLGEIRESYPINVRYSIPPWMEDEIGRYFDESRIESVLESFSSTPSLHMRINPLKGGEESIYSAIREEGVEFSFHPAVRDCLIIHNPMPLERFRAFRDGLVTPQDAGAVVVAQVVAEVAELNCEGGGRLLDLCSAPGIKTSYLKFLLPQWELWATDVSPKRIEGMKKNFKRMGVEGVNVRRIDFTGEVPGEFKGAFDVVFVDAPCSGLGVMRRNPEVKWRIGKDDIDMCGEKAGKILENALLCVRKGGVCLYSTCTFTEKENEGVVKTVFQRVDCVIESVEALVAKAPLEMVGKFSLITPPDIFDSDFFFIALLKK